MNVPPILSMLRRYSEGNPARFHMPGHMGRAQSLPFALDVTELDATDSLYDGGPAVRRARALAAAACGASDTFLLVGGATVGIHVMMAYADGPVTISRGAHRSAFAGGWLSGREPAVIEPGWDAGEALYRCEIPSLRSAAGANGWVLATSPDYYGCVGGLEPLSGPRLLVDAAHGAHFSFGRRLPSGPAGRAHIWVEGAHKTLPAPTQTAWLHCSSAADVRRIERLLAAMETSSPSWLLLAGLDRARAEAEESRDAWDALAVRCRELEREIGALAGLRACGEEWAAARGYAGKDPTRLVVDVRDAGYSGFEAAARLREDGVYPEMADFYRVVMIATPRNTCEDFDRLAASLRRLSRNGTGEAYAVDLTPPGTPERVCPAAEAFARPARLVSLERAAGQVAAAAAGAYPPGTPCWLPGERITADAVDWLLRVRSLGGRLFGVDHERAEVMA